MVVKQEAIDNNLLVIDELSEFWSKNNFGLYPHQIETANRVINELDGRALLADEVGLGKTIEAGLIIKEYLLRGEIDNFLVLTPASLGYQWWVELTNKFDIDLFNNRKGKGWHYFNNQIASIDLAKREPHCNYIYDRGFDMIIVDEAHKLKNNKTMNWKFVNNLSPKYMLFLTATPIQNELKELYNLISLLKPKLFKNYSDFKTNFERQTPKYEVLKDKLSNVMIRNKRVESKLDYTERKVKLIPLKLSPSEQRLYDGLTDLIKAEYQRCVSENKSILHLVTLQREICSSSFAVINTLKDFMESASEEIKPQLRKLLNLAKGITINQKVKIVEEILKKVDGQAVIFTEYLATQDYICRYLYNRGIMPVKFDGSLTDTQKEWAKYRFAEAGDVLVSTEAGGQGINLQFCNVIINYDLPWNPMKLEQRIGRVHRLGQSRDVEIYNLSTRGTIEEKVLNLLYQKIGLFESVIGDLDKIVNDLQDENISESDIFKIIINTGEEKLKNNLEELPHDHIMQKSF
ncbi:MULTISPECIES: DEAD/DEAH box helicase [unclassified Candidatus Frackibacter]|uniref:DEAD/DEAH box helicase n=1 Tax=unclassified Candidatus Frackibacter TaxID=2648818 RepID=UPI0008921BFF|nr:MULTISPECIES: SNF2-related protein [unclassified Candidatus Frackibacter]SDB97700.1 Helicase conserved C-terminal domain-containing protein [Candidatus Frackibacter sp. WG11]SEM29399.1 Helicase conserved C-terminal domain-containing protein [Candidatus Frackibacter sp. WG12]SFL34286.1 Helicase conserved C-terminal domain-containing protein [Candidatus Frackibacter sp. WG13]